ncbi:MAG: hypothetical protein UW24_C0006G0024 [Parcubacteria group bacterium GW2011_GWA2_44_12]|nr:MAG: hypothetical protein UW24_C0006G0024 [Parcubacteria group bacterium GW2011_GWA2_44_12]
MLAFMDTSKVLQQLGLSEKEAVVYLASLQLGKDTAFTIAKRSGIKRSTVYVILNELNIKGLVDISKTAKATLYNPVSPKKLLQQMDFRKNQLEEALPELLLLYKDKPEKPSVHISEGSRGVEQVYREIIDSVKAGEEVLCFGQLKHFESGYKKLLETWIREMKNKKNRAREILPKNEYESVYRERIKQNRNPHHRIKVAPSGMLVNDNIIYADKVGIFSVEHDAFVVLIESKHIAEAYRNVFEFLWTHSEEV